MIDGDTIMSSGSVEAALRAAGAVVAGVDAVMGGKADTAFAAVRPPGHHATPGHSRRLLPVQQRRDRRTPCSGQARPLDGSRSSISTSITARAPRQWSSPTPPCSTARRTNIRSIPVPAMPASAASTTTSPTCRYGPTAAAPNSGNAWGDTILPQLDRFAPELVIVSAGFDGHKVDPLAQLNLETEDFAWITRELLAIADRHAKGRLVSALEGGYDLDALADATQAHVARVDADVNKAARNR